jgi:tetratricopeptide (TPR) repeat protein/2-polyprenyl-3-methyl-5-hydroxy-6-metoxy-1,4-benzoquinol methylase
MELTIEQALQKAVESHREGKLQVAESMYRAILQAQPNHPDANHNLGVLAVSVKNTAAALTLFETALKAKPSQEQFWLSYIDALIEVQQFDRAKIILNQGKKIGFKGITLDAIEAQLLKSISTKYQEASLTETTLNFAQQQKKVSTKKEKRKTTHSQNGFNKSKNPSQLEVSSMLESYRTGKIELAEQFAKDIIQKHPAHQLSWKLLGALFEQSGRLEESLLANQRSVEISPNGEEAHSNLGNTLLKLGRLAEAEACYRKAIIIKPNFPAAYNNLANTLLNLGRIEEAAINYRKAIALNPHYSKAHSNFGNLLQALGRLEEAKTSYKKAITINPEFAEAHTNLGNILQELGRLEEAEVSHRKAISSKPEFAEAHNNLGNTLKFVGRLEESVASYRRAIAIKPEYAEAHSNLGHTLKVLGRPKEAFISVITSIKIKPTVEAKQLFIDIAKHIDVTNWNQSLAQLATNALLEPWGRPSDLFPFAYKLLNNNPEFIGFLEKLKGDKGQLLLDKDLVSSISKNEFSGTSLLQAMLSSSLIPSPKLESLLTLLRHHFLKDAQYKALTKSETEDVTPFYCSLAQQCFINEYVYYQTAEEIGLSQQLRYQLTQALEEVGNVSADLIIAVACYFPLYSVAGSEKLLHKKWPTHIQSVLIQQIQEPLDELNLTKSIPILTITENQVSLVVQSQYEENPYPRWVCLPKASSKRFLNSYFQNKFPKSSFKRLADDKNPDILIAGCGTGQHPISTSQVFLGAKLLAIDLSMASLAYAKRKTAELDIHSIEYAQADLLKLSCEWRTFDVIESSGVLHHLENPFEGWNVLLSLLRPQGLIRLGFYSELARRDIVRVRNLISTEAIGSSFQEIRDYRKHLFELNDSEHFGFATSSSDFFSTSACRDLLFHVQEHRMNLNVIAEFLKDQNLNFLGFEIDNLVIQKYLSRFPNDPSATDLSQWSIFEEENQDTFNGMYQFWSQKN